MSAAAFSDVVERAMAARDIGLRELCRAVELDPSFFSKVLSGKRSPPSEEDVLRKIAEFLNLDPVEVIVSAGRIPEEWSSLQSNPDLIKAVHSLASSSRPSSQKSPVMSQAASRTVVKQSVAVVPVRQIAPRKDLSEELL